MGDFDNDGQLDVLLTGLTSSPTSGVWRNLGYETFTNVNAGLPGVFLSSATWGDLDNNGTMDILLTGNETNFSPYCDPCTPTKPVCAVWWNYNLITNTPPTAPINLSTTVSGTGVVLNWGAATDAQTPSSGLYYNVRVGTTPGGFDVMSPMADPVSGFRRVPQIGNAQERLFSYLTNLTIGTTYYWSVQAIDTAWANGPFAPESSFTVAPALSAGYNAPRLCARLRKFRLRHHRHFRFPGNCTILHQPAQLDPGLVQHTRRRPVAFHRFPGRSQFQSLLSRGDPLTSTFAIHDQPASALSAPFSVGSLVSACWIHRITTGRLGSPSSPNEP